MTRTRSVILDYFLVLCVVGLSSVVLSVGCRNSFEPKGPFVEKLVVYSILSPDQPAQFVRVHRTYDPPSFDSPMHASAAVEDAMAVIRESSLTYVLADTILTRLDKSRYKEDIKAFFTTSIQSFHGKTFELTITSPSLGIARSSITIPTKPSMSYEGHSALDNPEPSPNPRIRFSAVLSSQTAGYLIRMLLECEVQRGDKWEVRRVEVPIGFKLVGEGNIVYENGIFPKMTRNQSMNAAQGFPNNAYLSTLSKVRNEGFEKVIFKKVVFTLMQAERNLYAYYNIANAFQDPASIRVDQPEYSNIQGGYGLFGGYAIDSIVHRLPDNFGFNVQ